MELFTVEAFNGKGYDLILATEDREKALIVKPSDFNTTALVKSTWENGKKTCRVICEEVMSF